LFRKQKQKDVSLPYLYKKHNVSDINEMEQLSKDYLAKERICNSSDDKTTVIYIPPYTACCFF
jgi:hypothetical protein